MLLLCMLTPSVVVRRLNPFSFLMLCTWFFSFSLKLIESCLFPRILNFTVIFLFMNLFSLIVLNTQCVLSICWYLLLSISSIFLSRTPIICMLYFLGQSSDLLTFSFLFPVSLSFCSFGGNFLNFNFQPVDWVFFFVIVLNFLFSSINSCFFVCFCFFF